MPNQTVTAPVIPSAISSAPSPFDPELPQFQIAWDSTSLSDLKTCPRKYQLTMLERWQPKREPLPLKFGILFHKSFEIYEHARAEGQNHHEAVRTTVRWALETTWERDEEAGISRPWTPDDPRRGRLSLVRCIVWYWDWFQHDAATTIKLRSGKPAVELSFKMEIPYSSPSGEPLLLCGHMDRLIEYSDQTWVMDHKTTVQALYTSYFDQYSPDNQMSLYTLAAKVVYETEVAGAIINGVQLATHFTRFARGFALRSEAQLDEWLNDTKLVIAHAEQYAEAGYWPMNDKSCHHYGGCPYRSVCSSAPGVRQLELNTAFTQGRQWNPLANR